MEAMSTSEDIDLNHSQSEYFDVDFLMMRNVNNHCKRLAITGVYRFD